MITGNRDYEGDDDLAGLVNGLEQLARHLDAQHYPGRTWPVLAVRRLRPFAWPLVAPLAAVAVAAAVVAILAYHGRVPQSPMVPAPHGGEMVRQSPRLPESSTSSESLDCRIAIPPVVVVEDADSYSFIDTTAGAPLVSFATKDSCSPRCVVPVLPEPASPAAEAEEFDPYQGPPAEKGRAGGDTSGPRGDT